MTRAFRSLPDRDTDERAVRAVERAYDDAWGVGDVDGVLACLADGVVVVNPRGMVARGHAEFRRELEDLFSGEFAGSRHTSEVLCVSFVTDEVAIVDGQAVVESADRQARVLAHRYTDVLVRHGQRWVISHMRAYALAERAATSS